MIPRVTTRDISKSGDVGPERVTETRVDDPDFGIVREIEIGLIFDERTAIEIRDWLNKRIGEFEEARASLEGSGDNPNGAGNPRDRVPSIALPVNHHYLRRLKCRISR